MKALLACKALVRPHLEYASPVWDPWIDKQRKEIEAVQWRATRKTVGREQPKLSQIYLMIWNRLALPSASLTSLHIKLSMVNQHWKSHSLSKGVIVSYDPFTETSLFTM